MSLYWILLLFSISVPLLLSFDKKLHFYTHWGYLFPAMLITAAIYIGFDLFFTHIGVWGFNNEYLSGIYVYNLPLEEVLFFIVIPYASIFLHETIKTYFPTLVLSDSIARVVTYVLIGASILILIYAFDKTYTLYILSTLIVVLIVAQFDSTKSINQFYLSFLVILIPFFIVNGILTGSFIEGEVVWYNNSENMGIRVGTIPIEDFIYAFTLIYINILLMSRFKMRYNKSKSKAV